MKQRMMLFLIFFLGTSLGSAHEPTSPYTEATVDSHRCLIMEPKDLPDAAPLVILIHGLGGDARNLVPFWIELNLPPCRVVCPDGIFPSPVTPRGYSWYYPLFNEKNEEDIRKSRNYLLKLVRRFGPERPVVFMGFSQGGVMSIQAGLRCPNKVLAIVDMSGYIPDPSEDLKDLKAPLDVPILMLHGSADTIVPIAVAHAAEKALIEKGYKPRFKTIAMSHEVNQEELDTIHDLLWKVLSKGNE